LRPWWPAQPGPAWSLLSRQADSWPCSMEQGVGGISPMASPPLGRPAAPAHGAHTSSLCVSSIPLWTHRNLFAPNQPQDPEPEHVTVTMCHPPPSCQDSISLAPIFFPLIQACGAWSQEGRRTGIEEGLVAPVFLQTCLSLSPTVSRSPPRPSPGSLHYSDEDVTKYNDLIPAESSSLTEKPSEISDSQVRGRKARTGKNTAP
jgi:hypothetical protein